MSYGVIALLLVGLLLIFKLLEGFIKLLLVLVVVGLLVATFASKDQIDGAPAAAKSDT